MRDVAERANVSIATVSFVVNQTKPVSALTQSRVLAAMGELGYRRNVVARALASRRTRNIALLYPALDHRLGTTALGFVTSAASAAAARGYNMVLWPVSNDADQMSDLIAGGLVDGVLLMEVEMDDPRVERLVSSNVPFALIGRTRDPAGIAFVDIDFEAMTEAAIEYLIGLGHSKIALVLERLEHSAMVGYSPPIRTEATFMARMRERSLLSVVITCDETPQGGRDAAGWVLEKLPDVTAVMIMNDVAAFGMIGRLVASGLSVPHDVSVISLATTPEMATLSEPTLTSMHSPGNKIGKMGMDILIDRLEGKSEETPQILVPCDFELNESTAPALERNAQTNRIAN